MQDDLVVKLSEFGFTTNQAKVYLTIVQHGSNTAGKISKLAQLHRQDVYITLSKLEKMGLIIKTIDKPALIEAIPIEKALSRLVSNEKNKAKTRISFLEDNLKKLSDAVINNQNSEEMQEENEFIPLMTDDQVKNRATLTFERVKKECDLFFDFEMINGLTSDLKKRFRKIDKGVKIRIIIKNVENMKAVMSIIKKISHPNNKIEVKIIQDDGSIPYYIFDQRELWVSMEKKTEIGLPCVLWTNDKNMIKFFQYNFNEAWDTPKANTVYPLRTIISELVNA
jgi:sugar-specific transcriptional regulator TrmB